MCEKDVCLGVGWASEEGKGLDVVSGHVWFKRRQQRQESVGWNRRGESMFAFVCVDAAPTRSGKSSEAASESLVMMMRREKKRRPVFVDVVSLSRDGSFCLCVREACVCDGWR